MCALPRLEESQRRLGVDTLGQVTTPALGDQTDWAGLSISFEKLRWQISTHYFTVTIELEDALEVDVTKLLMYSLNVLCRNDIFKQCADGRCCVIRDLVIIHRRDHLDVREATLAGRRRNRGGGRNE